MARSTPSGPTGAPPWRPSMRKASRPPLRQIIEATLRALGRMTAPARLTVRQGEDLGRPSELLVDGDPASGHINLRSAANWVFGGTPTEDPQVSGLRLAENHETA